MTLMNCTHTQGMKKSLGWGCETAENDILKFDASLSYSIDRFIDSKTVQPHWGTSPAQVALYFIKNGRV